MVNRDSSASPDGYVPVAVERVVEATPLPQFEHPERAMYLFGPENGSLDETMLERCAHAYLQCERPCPSDWSTPRSLRRRSRGAGLLAQGG